ncbi:MAG: RHS repeat protein [Cytophagaceae bacterium]|nr:RHS repeat protein [Cytophagaceae bacterium]MBK9935677.1 RHS repeat protein [Cytophagaceae bacterium]MBL0302119.1 RHS repeat protein [Cytophagaceae bacterium]MBL0324940.1 RHS repeat protein [Cytophagaceae bacterium]
MKQLFSIIRNAKFSIYSVCLLLVFSACEEEEKTPLNTNEIPVVNTAKDPCQVSIAKSTSIINGVEGEVEETDYAFNKATNKLTATKKSKKFGTTTATTYSFDAKNRLIEENGALGYRKYSYNNDGKLSEFAIDMQGSGGLKIYKYNYKNATTIEKHEYGNSVTDANLKQTWIFTIDANDNATKVDYLVFANGKYSRSSLSNYNYNDKGQLLSYTVQTGPTTSYSYRYEYDAAGNNTKVFSKLNDAAEIITEEYSEFSNIPIPKVSFAEWELLVKEPFSYGKILSNTGLIISYSNGLKTSEFSRKYEYNSNNILIKTTEKYTYKGEIEEKIKERTIKCQ